MPALVPRGAAATVLAALGVTVIIYTSGSNMGIVEGARMQLEKVNMMKVNDPTKMMPEDVAGALRARGRTLGR